MIHCPIRLHLQNISSKSKLFQISKQLQQSIKPSTGPFWVQGHMRLPRSRLWRQPWEKLSQQRARPQPSKVKECHIKSLHQWAATAQLSNLPAVSTGKWQVVSKPVSWNLETNLFNQFTNSLLKQKHELGQHCTNLRLSGVLFPIAKRLLQVDSFAGWLQKHSCNCSNVSHKTLAWWRERKQGNFLSNNN